MSNENNCLMCKRWEQDNDLQIAELNHSYVTLNRDQFFPGYALLFTKDHVTELFHLDKSIRSELTEEISLIAKALYNVFQPDKINYELLGNMVPHMHWHLVPRFSSDPLWPRPIWSEPHTELQLTMEEYTKRISQIRKAI
jgi:diadenosine tetraphosphate (Ap4A) HIT family hydrolase